MFTLQKNTEKDFLILNLSDPQLGDSEWDETHKNYRILTETVKTLIDRVHPDLITVSGDLSWAGNNIAYEKLASFLDSFQIPWAPVWGNHDNQGGPEVIDSVADTYMKHPFCLYEKGDPVIGNGNYIIRIEENGRPVEAILMMDSHDRDPYKNEKGEDTMVWAKLIPEQLDWYREQIAILTADGYTDTTMIMHIPIYAYRDAWEAAIRPGIQFEKLTVADSHTGDCWNEGYKDSFGVRYEGICSYPEDEGAFAVIRELGSTKHIISGHDHVNNFVISHEGVKFIYSLKAGAGCYWNPALNGGTVLRITGTGVADVWHEYVDPTPYMQG
ncbi:MAG: metallophosphoesterase [Clostridia bacterium]|nr:metallophosphoesterase [Clostridia bacterium]